MKIIDLFSGCGGLSLGFLQKGYTITKAVEYDPQIANSYKMNHPGVEVIVDDIKNIDQTKKFDINEADVIIGGPPCQGFSMAGARIRNGFMDDPRNYLFKHYFNIVKKVKPKAFIMENVKGIMTMQEGKIFNEILKIFSDPELMEGDTYTLNYRVVKATDFGIPQKRERLILIGVKNINFSFDETWEKTKNKISKNIPDFFDVVTIKDAIGNLTTPTDDGIISNPSPITRYQKYLASKNEKIKNHIKTKHSKIAIERMKKISSGENFKVLDENIKSVHSGAYGRLRWNESAPTIMTRFDTPAGGRFIHPEENRTLTPREAARIQSFPDDFIFYGNKTIICKQIGNAVPPKISFFLANLIEEIFNIGVIE